MELRVGVIMFAGVLCLIGLTQGTSFVMVQTGMMSAGSGDMMVRVAMYLGTAVLGLGLIGMVARDGFRKVKTVRRDVREGAARGVKEAQWEKESAKVEQQRGNLQDKSRSL